MQFSIFLTTLAASLAMAAPQTLPPASGNQCGTGSLQCCNSVQDASNGPVQSLLSGLSGLAGIGAALGASGNVGLTCNPIAGFIGAAGNNCAQQAACCSGDNIQGGLLVLECSPINLGL